MILIAICSVLTACGFKLRSNTALPPSLRTLALSTPNPESSFNNELSELLRSLHIKLVKPNQTAPVKLKISQYSFTHNTPELTTTGTIITYTYSLTVTASLVNARGQTIVPDRTFNIFQDIAQIPSSNYLSMPPPNTEEQMRQNIIIQIFYWLTSTNTADALETIKVH